MLYYSSDIRMYTYLLFFFCNNVCNTTSIVILARIYDHISYKSYIIIFLCRCNNIFNYCCNSSTHYMIIYCIMLCSECKKKKTCVYKVVIIKLRETIKYENNVEWKTHIHLMSVDKFISRVFEK